MLGFISGDLFCETSIALLFGFMSRASRALFGFMYRASKSIAAQEPHSQEKINKKKSWTAAAEQIE